MKGRKLRHERARAEGFKARANILARQLEEEREKREEIEEKYSKLLKNSYHPGGIVSTNNPYQTIKVTYAKKM